MPDFEESGIPTQEEVLQLYSTLAKREVKKTDWHFCMAFYCWRGAIISQGIGARLVSGQASSKAAEYFASLAPLLALRAQSELEELVKLQPIARKSPVLIQDDFHYP